MSRVWALSFMLVALAAAVVSAEWSERPGFTATFRTFRNDLDLRLAGSAAYFLAMPWQPRLAWDASGRMSHVGALDREKRDSVFRARVEITPRPGCRLKLATEGWRRRDVGSQLLERARGAAAEAQIALTGPTGITLTQALGAIRDRVASAGLAGEERDNGGLRSQTQIGMSQTWGSRTCDLQFRRISRDVALDGSDDRAITVRFGGLPGEAGFEVFKNQRRYRAGSVEESRTETGRSLRCAGGVGTTASVEFRGASSTSSYREGTTQDFSNSSQELQVQLTHALGALTPLLRASLRHRSYDERQRTIYDRDDDGRAIEAGVTISPLDSSITLHIGHSLSLDQNTYADPANYSDHDIRDQKMVADLAWRRERTSCGLTLIRRRNDLVYIDPERSANTVKNAEYSASFDYGLPVRGLRWSQTYYLSARYAFYRFRPESDALSRRGSVESRLGGSRGRYEVELFQRWLWDDSGPFHDQLFQRLELTEDVEMGARARINAEGWLVGPGLRQRWRFVYGPGGRAGGLARPAQIERRASLDVKAPLGSRGLSVTATRVHSGNSGYWEASAEVGNAW